MSKIRNSSQRQFSSQTAGFTLVDVMLTVLVLTIALVGTMIAFPNIMKAILVSKARSMATIIAQEQLEYYKNISYYKLQVTTNPITDNRFSPAIQHDNGYYPVEKIVTGGIEYEKVVYIEKVVDVGGNFVHIDWAQPDAGMKRVFVYVIFKFEGASGNWKKVSLNGFLENPNRQSLDATISGVVRTTDTVPIPIPNAAISVWENQAFQTTSNSGGNYSFNVPVGSWTLITSATGYFTDFSTPIVVASGGTATQNISLRRMFLANVTGYVFIQDHLLITEVVTSTTVGSSGEQEWVELYNPTTYNILIASRSSPASPFNIFFVTVSWINSSNDEPSGSVSSKFLVGNFSVPGSTFTAFRSTSSNWSANTSTISIPSQRFFLIANKSTVTFATPTGTVQRIADAYYSGNVIDGGGPGGIRVTGSSGYSFNGRSDWHDGFAWGSSGDISKAREGPEEFNYSGSLVGTLFYRHSFKSGPNSATAFSRNSPPFSGNSFDQDSSSSSTNGSDWALYSTISSLLTTSSAVYNSNFSAPPYSGTPAVGGIITSDDGLSAAAFVQSYGSFTLTNVSTGAWKVSMTSSTSRGSLYQEIYTTVTVATPFLGIPNSLTTPQWNFNVNFSSLSLTTTNGIIAGRVTGGTGMGIGNITIDASGQTTPTNSQGYYRLSVTSGIYTVGCNLVNVNNSYTQTSSVNVTVQTGQTTNNVDFSLVAGGNLEGFITLNGIDPLPGYVVSLQKNGAEYDSGTSGANGKFLLTNVATVPASAPYTLYCVVDSGETVSLSTGIICAPQIGATLHVGTFTVTAGFGTFTGNVTLGGSPIPTGVLVVASTRTIVTISSGPTINSTLVAGTTTYYFTASDANGKYQLKVLGNTVGTTYYIYGWYTDESFSILRRNTTNYIKVGESKTANLQW